MELSQAYILMAIVALAIIVAGLFFINKNKKIELTPMTPLGGIAFVLVMFAFVIAGIAFDGDVLVGYSLMVAGIILAVADTILKMKKNKK
ncbi:MAG: hypothetical protein ABIJ34_09100 [archaeon]|nr:hypothetical protein [Candidatus Micrarchaeota archaeon]MBU1166164.1 hypothetical protein [Candidatus Micrarchaeota archaeon]MBU1886562.1 hypothetical protein [Candidatus Micrarchaeota archaeon]